MNKLSWESVGRSGEAWRQVDRAEAIILAFAELAPEYGLVEWYRQLSPIAALGRSLFAPTLGQFNE